MTPLWACRAIIFDLDGTLTVPQHNFDEIRDALGIPQGALILEHLAALPQPEQRDKRAELDAIELAIAKESQPAPGVIELLNQLRANNLPFAILTRNSARNAWASLHAISADEYFSADLVIGRDEATPKPDPAGINLLAGRLGHAPTNCAMVGDFRHDLEAGTRAGCHTVHIRHGDARVWPEITQTTVNSLEALRTELNI